MKIERVYIGGWFQRTTLHLSEVYDFLREGTSGLEQLSADKLRHLREQLEIESVEMELVGLEHISLQTKSGTRVTLYEDGLIVLCRDYKNGEVSADIKWLADYYEHKLSPAISYLFSLGAPVPKELANIKTIYPYFVVVKDASAAEVSGLLRQFEQKKYFEIKNEHFDIFRGDIYYVVNNKTESLETVERFIEEQIFLREFKGQLHRYLHLHRIIWERIAEVKERGHISGGEIGAFRDKVEAYAKTINLIEARMGQMGTYLRTRERIAKEGELKDFLPIIGYRYETLGDTLDYMRQIWQMTKNYVNSSLDLFGSLQSQATQNSVRNLTVVTSMGVGATLIGLFTTNSAPKFTEFGVAYFLILAAIGYGADKATKWFYRHKSYAISEVQYDKDIK